MGATSYDVVAIGSGPAGRHAALQAARLGRRAAVVEREDLLGGTATSVGTPTRVLRAAILELTGQAHGVYAGLRRSRQELTMDDLLWRIEQVVERERDALRDELRRGAVDLIAGNPAFVDPHTLELDGRAIVAERFVIAVGTRPVRPPDVEFDGRTIVDADGLVGLKRIPRTLTIVGGGVTGLEQASMASALGVHVTVVEREKHLLRFLDDEIAEALTYHLRGLGVRLRLGEEAEAVRRMDGGAIVHLRGGYELGSEVVVYAGGCEGATGGLNLPAAGVETDEWKRIPVTREHRTNVRHIFAAGECAGSSPPSPTDADDGRRAALAALGEPAPPAPLHPYGIYTIPEVSCVGPTERDLTATASPYVVGTARYRELARGEIAGDRTGLLKLLVDPEKRCVLGVHIFGTGATELVHLGQAFAAAGLDVDSLAQTVFNSSTFSDGYRVAALDASARLREPNGEPAATAA